MKRVQLKKPQMRAGKNGGKLVVTNKGERRGGRTKGVPNRMTRLLKDAIIEAAERVGRDGKGKDGLVGFLERAARKDLKAFLPLLGKVLPLQINMSETPEDEATKNARMTIDEIRAEFVRRGLPPVKSIFKAPKVIDVTPNKVSVRAKTDDEDTGP